VVNVSITRIVLFLYGGSDWLQQASVAAEVEGACCQLPDDASALWTSENKGGEALWADVSRDSVEGGVMRIHLRCLICNGTEK